MSLDVRAAAVEEFKTDPEVTFLAFYAYLLALYADTDSFPPFNK
jgi:hypothetical protein